MDFMGRSGWKVGVMGCSREIEMWRGDPVGKSLEVFRGCITPRVII